MSHIELKAHELRFNEDHHIVAACMYGPDRLVLVYTDGRVCSYLAETGTIEHLFTLSDSDISFPDGGFDISAPTSVYTMDDIVVVVNDFRSHGWVYTPKNGKVHLWRKDYHADISKFPIALFKNDAGVPHLIYGTDWNRVDIMDLNSLEIHTENKTLIDERGEENHKKYLVESGNEKSNELMTPMTYDYFYGALEMSPDNKHFLSKGWVWGSSDRCDVYDVDHFIKSDTLRACTVGAGDHQNRAICWIDNKTIAITHHKYFDGDGITHKDSPTEILILDISTDRGNEIIRFALDVFDGLSGQMYFSPSLNALVILTETKGMTVCDLQGNILLRKASLVANCFHAASNSFLSILGARTMTVYRLSM